MLPKRMLGKFNREQRWLAKARVHSFFHCVFATFVLPYSAVGSSPIPIIIEAIPLFTSQQFPFDAPWAITVNSL